MIVSQPKFSHLSPDKAIQVVQDIQLPIILAKHPAEIVDIALNALQRLGVQVIEWRALLYRRMNIPILVSNYSYAVPDEDIDRASDVLESIGLTSSPPSKFQRKCYGDFCEKGAFYRITKSTLPSSIQHIILYPLSFTTLSLDDVVLQTPIHIQPSKCRNILVPRHWAVYASIIRMISQYPRYSRTRTSLESDLSELIGYHLFDLENGYADPNNADWGILQVDRRVENAVNLTLEWNRVIEWRESEEWIGDALVAIVSGAGIDNLPHS